MADTNRDPQPLESNQPITKDGGTPTDYFIRWAQDRQLAIKDGLTFAELDDFLAAHTLHAGTGIAITPTGSIADNPTISLNAGLGDLHDVDLVTTPPVTGNTIQYSSVTGKWTPHAGGGGGGGGTPPTLVGVQCTPYNAASVNAILPTAPHVPVAGDLAIIGAHSAWAVNIPAGCIALDNSPGSNSNGATFYKILTAADITNGYITVTFAGSYYGSVGIAVLLAASVTSLQSFSAERLGGSVGVNYRPMLGSSTGTMIFVFGGARGNGIVSLFPIDDIWASTGADGSGTVGVYTPVGPSLTERFTYAADGGGSYSTVVVVNGT